MDPVTVIGLVSSIIQLVDFSGQLISKTAQLYRSADSALAENLDIEAATKDLTQLNEKLKASVATGDAALEQLCNSCNAVGDELLGALSKLKVNGKQPKWQSARKALRSIWSKEKINQLESRLAMFREELNLRITVGLREQVSQLRLEQSDNFSKLDVVTRKLATAIIHQDDVFLAIKDEQNILTTTLHNETAATIQLQHQTTRQVILQAIQTSSITEEKLAKVRSWLSPPDPSQNYQRALKERQINTGLWFVESDQYVNWRADTASSPFLWLYGIPGSGKTILSSTVVENVLQHCANGLETAVAYFYFVFNDREKQSSELMVRSLICQLSQKCTTVPAALEALFASCNDGSSQPSLYGLLDVLREMIRTFPQSFIVLDALDECEDRSELMTIIESIAGWQLEKLHILVTSRRERDIENTLEMLVHPGDITDLRAEVVDKDIEAYIEHRLNVDKNLRKWQKNPEIRREIEGALMEKAKGMFRWAVCQLDSLAKCLNRLQLRRALQDLPGTLDETYDRILLSIDNDHYAEYALRMLKWLAFSSRPLRIHEIAEAVAINVECASFNPDEILEDPLDALKICSGLVSLATPDSLLDDSDHEDDTADSGEDDSRSRQPTIVLAHYSVKEYLVSERIQRNQMKRYSLQEAACHSYIARSCLSYLFQFDDAASFCNETFRTSELAIYSATFWTEHTRAAGKGDEILLQLIMELFLRRKGAFLNSLRIRDSESVWDSDITSTLENIRSPLYWASQAGLTEAVEELVCNAGLDVNPEYGRSSHNALIIASDAGHYDIVELLLSNGADVNAQGGFYGNALQTALDSGSESLIAELLLISNGADVNAQGGGHGDALQAALTSGSENLIAELLLSNDADVNMQGGSYGNAHQSALFSGSEKIAELLLSNGADVNAQGSFYGTALQAASRLGSERIAELLLSNGADVNAQGGSCGNALQAASYSKSERIAELLLSNGADVNAQGGQFGNALQAASYSGSEKIVELLLSNGADVNAQGGQFDDALQAASFSGSEKIAELLLSNGADVYTQGGGHGDALQIALNRGNSKIVKLLVSNGAITPNKLEDLGSSGIVTVTI